MQSVERLKPIAMVAKSKTNFDVEAIRRDFPIFSQKIHGHTLAYLDNAASSQVPKSVIATVNAFYAQDKSNVHRGVHELSQRATRCFEAARTKVKELLGAPDRREIIFVRGTTEAINLVAQTCGRANVGKGDEVIISEMEHHSNIVPWQMLCQEKGATLKVVPMNDKGELIQSRYREILSPRTKLVAIAHISNALGTINPVKEMIQQAHAVGAVVMLDGAQAVPHMVVDVMDLDCDFYAFSGHKAFAPNGIGVLYGKQELLEAMPPYQGGGDMIRLVTFEKTTYNELPYRFEAGTPNVAGVIGLGAAIDYINQVGYENLAAHETELLHYGEKVLAAVPGIRFIGTAAARASVLSFTLEGIHPHDIGTIVDHEGIAVRAGHHCAQPVMQHFDVAATIRASFAFYNTKAEIDRLGVALHKAIEVFA